MKNLPNVFSENVEKLDHPISSFYLSWNNRLSNRNAFQSKLAGLIREARTLLKKELDDEELHAYLLPIFDAVSRIKDPLPDAAGLAIFRTRKDFWIIQMTQDPGNFVAVADSFHLKPLVYQLQNPKRYAVLWFHPNGAILAHSNERQTFVIDSVLGSGERKNAKAFALELKKMLSDLVKDSRIEIMMAGDPSMIRRFNDSKVHPGIRGLVVPGTSAAREFNQVALAANSYIQQLNLKDELRILGQVFELVKTRRFILETNLELIARHAIERRVVRLIVAKDQMLFGAIDKRSGKVTYNGVQHDCRDDDLFDDLSELVSKNGGQVVVASKKNIPGNTGVFAVIEPDLLIPQFENSFGGMTDHQQESA